MPHRVVVISGGSRGLGRAIVEGFMARPDCCVATCSREKTAFIEGLSSNSELSKRFLFDEVDIRNRAAVHGFVERVHARYGRVDVLVNNASVAADGVLATFSDEALDAVIDVDVKGTIYLTKCCSRKMLLNGGGRIINISSIVGRSGYRGLSVYSAAKAAMDGFTRSLARELGARKITVNSIAPGYMPTDMSHGLSEQQLEQIVRRTPLGRLCSAEDIVSLVMYLCSAEAGFITGQTIVVDGGLTV